MVSLQKSRGAVLSLSRAFCSYPQAHLEEGCLQPQEYQVWEAFESQKVPWLVLYPEGIAIILGPTFEAQLYLRLIWE